MRTIKASIILSSGTTQLTSDYIIENVKRYVTMSNHHYIETENEEYYFPMERTIIKVTKSK